VLLTGAAGFIGAHVVRGLIARGDEVLALVRPSTPLRRIEAVIDRIRVVTAALEDTARLEAVLKDFQPQVTVHLAWYARPEDYLNAVANLESLAVTSAFVERAFRFGCRKVIGLGTSLEYAASNALRRESDAVDPVSLYASCKLGAWFVCRALARQHGAEVVWGRLFHVHGFGEDAARLIPAVARSLAAGKPFDLSPGLQVRDHLHVSDVAAAIIRLMDPGITGIVNVCSGVPVTLRDVLLAVGDILGKRDLLRFGARPYNPNEVMFLAGDPGLLRAIGWAPRLSDMRASLMDVVSEHTGRPGESWDRMRS
jgi:dTDP-6-deoxy-L-talose 4-dehydrogenase (NAD+)